MSILKHDEKQDGEQEIYFNFINSLRSEVTKKEYEREIRLFMRFCNVTRLSNLLDLETDTPKQIIKYIMSLKERGLSFNSISLSLYAIYHFYDMNDILLNKKKINMFKGEFKRKVSDRAYTYEEIKKILDISDLRMKSIVLLMASSGMRIGAIPLLKLRHLEKINDSNYKITLYEGTNDQYYTFCSPECMYYVDLYLQYRTENGEKLHKDSYLIRDQFDITDLEQVRNKSKGIALSTIKVILHNILIKCGVKTVDHSYRHNRKEVAESHGFRKFFTTQCINAKVNPEVREMLLGHNIGLTGSYYRPTEQEMLNEYHKAIDNLTINEENRLRNRVKILEIEKSRLDQLELSLKHLEEEYHRKNLTGEGLS